MAGYLSPVNDAYQKLGLVSARDRVSMCQLAVEDTSSWLLVDSWEARQPKYLPTAQVLDHFMEQINGKGGIDVSVLDQQTGELVVEQRKARIMLLAGSDLILTMSEPGVWAEDDVSNSASRPTNPIFLVTDPGWSVVWSASPHSGDLWMLHHRAGRVRVESFNL